MNRIAITILTSLALAAPAVAQDWGSDYNMGSIGVLGGSEATGTFSLDCAEAGNGVVRQGSLSVFLNPAAGTVAAAGDFVLDIDGEAITLPFADNQGDGFVHDKSASSLPALTALVDGLETGTVLVVTQGDTVVARIGLVGAAAALDGIDVCLVP